MAKAEEIGRRREELRSAYRVACEHVSSILLAEDPVGIDAQPHGDEYEPEAGTIVPRLRNSRSVDEVRRMVHEEFVAWFGVVTAGPSEKYQTIARRIWKEVVPGLTQS